MVLKVSVSVSGNREILYCYFFICLISFFLERKNAFFSCSWATRQTGPEFQSWPGVKKGKTGCEVCVGGASFTSPVNHSDVSQSRPLVSSGMWKRAVGIVTYRCGWFIRERIPLVHKARQFSRWLCGTCGDRRQENICSDLVVGSLHSSD